MFYRYECFAGGSCTFTFGAGRPVQQDVMRLSVSFSAHLTLRKSLETVAPPSHALLHATATYHPLMLQESSLPAATKRCWGHCSRLSSLLPLTKDFPILFQPMLEQHRWDGAKHERGSGGSDRKLLALVGHKTSLPRGYPHEWLVSLRFEDDTTGVRGVPCTVLRAEPPCGNNLLANLTLAWQPAITQVAPNSRPPLGFGIRPTSGAVRGATRGI